MKIYLASRYSRRLELCSYRARLRAMNYIVTSRWLDGAHQISDMGVPLGDDGEVLIESGDCERADALRTSFAVEDVEDVLRAEMFIGFTERPRSGHSRGGRHVELGIAIAMFKRILIVGPRENLFCYLPTIHHFDTFEAAATAIEAGQFS